MTMYYLPKRHIFVSETGPTIITDIIDFQAYPIEASFENAQIFLCFLEPKEPPDSEDEALAQL